MYLAYCNTDQEHTAKLLDEDVLTKIQSARFLCACMSIARCTHMY